MIHALAKMVRVQVMEFYYANNIIIKCTGLFQAITQNYSIENALCVYLT